jgi:hypothetical protein
MMNTAKKRIGQAEGGFNMMKCHSAIYPEQDGMSPKYLRRRGFAIVWVVLVIFTVFLFVGLTIDVGKLCLVNHQLHNAADAAALAGAVIVKIDPYEARVRAQEFASQNYADHSSVTLDLNLDNLPDGDIIIGQDGYDPDLDQTLFVPYDPEAPAPFNALAVITSRTNDCSDGPVPLLFGSLVDEPTAELAGNWVGKSGPYAIAVTVGGTGAGLICLRYDYTGLELGGGGFLTVNSETSNVNDGAIQINSYDDIGLYSNGGPTLDALCVNMCADDSVMKGQEVGLDSLLQYRQPPIPDPLASVPPPPIGSPVVEATNNGSPMPIVPGEITTVSTGMDVFFPAGYYPDGWRITGGQVTLEAGIYILGGYSQGTESGLYINGGNLDASAYTTGGGVEGMGGVMFYITGDGVCNIGGEGTVVVDPMTEAQCEASGALTAYEGISIFVDRESTNTSIIRGTSTLDLNGTLYFPQKIDHEPDYIGNGQQDYALELHGTGDGFGNQVIADSIYIPGTADVTINYDGRNRAPVTKAYLVE